MLHKNNIDIVACLKKLPITEHLNDSLKLDCTYFQPNMVTFSISGVFKEAKSTDEKYGPCFRSFYRTFVCIPTSNEK